MSLMIIRFMLWVALLICKILKMDSHNPFILIMAGQPLIRTKLALNINNPLRQRLVVKYIMQGLKSSEIKDYCNSRLRLAGMVEEIFSDSAIDAIYAATNGHLLGFCRR